MNLFRSITPAAIEVAERNADRAESAGYVVVPSTVAPNQYRVYRPDNAFYVCQPTIGTMGKCECEQWNNEGYCKHLELVARYEAWAERESEYEANEEGRFFMMECLAESLAETEGAWY